jgi:hypothetical protein
MAFRKLVLVTLLVAACGSVDHQKEAQGALDAGDADKAIQHAEEGLKAAGDDKAAAWRLEQIRLEALAKKGDAGKVAAELDRLHGAYPQQVTPALYLSLAQKVRAGGGAAPDVLAAADKKWPDDKTIDDAITEAAQQGDPAELERLRALGYIQ